MLMQPFEPGGVVRRSVGGQPTLLFCATPPGWRASAGIKGLGRREEGELQMDDALFDLLASTVRALGLELVDAEVRVGFVRVILDREGGVDVDEIAEATRAISRALDDHDPQPGRRYTLEVSSPGVERPLREPRQFIKAVGETVTVRTATGGQGERRLKGKLVAADEGGFTLEGEGLPGASRRFSYAEIERARTVFEWPASKQSPGARGTRASQRRTRAAKPTASGRAATEVERGDTANQQEQTEPVSEAALYTSASSERA